MPDARLHVALVWHMHQPLYRDPSTGNARLPWVRLHAWKDYLDMLLLAEEFPGVRMTFNMVPSLLEQVLDYAEGRASDPFMDHTLLPADDLTLDQKTFILESFFMAHPENMIGIFPRYRALYVKRGAHTPREALPEVARYFTSAEFRDIQVLFNLSWIDPILRERDPSLLALARKGEGFTEEDKEVVLASGRTILNEIVPAYKRACESGKIEISTTPYFHPILPLLIDTNLARAALPDAALPEPPFRHPEDAREQLARAVAQHRALFGREPRGLWPSEGSVCQALIPLAAEAGFSWMASDEEILARSLGLPIERDGHGLVRAPERLYRPYWAVEGSAQIAMIFRDHVLSDLIGFTYAGWPAEKAADDFIARLRAVRSACVERVRAPIVPIILDGENAWEFYPEDGVPFLRALYGRLEREDGIVTTTVSDYLRENPPAESLPAVFPGSWINHNFKIWIGHEEDNLAWQWLATTRDVLVKREAEAGLAPATREEAWRAIYAAEGSDWCWWYGDDHSSANDADFDELFRSHLRRVYELLDLRAPDGLWVPVLREERTVVPTTPCTAFIRPRIDGRVTHYYEWTSAALFDVKRAGATMHHAGGLVSVLTYGFNATHWFIRLDFTDPPSGTFPALGFVVHILRPRAARCFISLADGPAGAGQARRGRVRIENGEGEEIRRDAGEAALDEVLEAAIPFEALGFAPGDEAAFSIAVTDRGMEVERWPSRGAVSFIVPSADFEERMWRV